MVAYCLGCVLQAKFDGLWLEFRPDRTHQSSVQWKCRIYKVAFVTSHFTCQAIQIPSWHLCLKLPSMPGLRSNSRASRIQALTVHMQTKQIPKAYHLGLRDSRSKKSCSLLPVVNIALVKACYHNPNSDIEAHIFTTNCFKQRSRFVYSSLYFTMWPANPPVKHATL